MSLEDIEDEMRTQRIRDLWKGMTWDYRYFYTHGQISDDPNDPVRQEIRSRFGEFVEFKEEGIHYFLKKPTAKDAKTTE